MHSLLLCCLIAVCLTQTPATWSDLPRIDCGQYTLMVGGGGYTPNDTYWLNVPFSKTMFDAPYVILSIQSFEITNSGPLYFQGSVLSMTTANFVLQFTYSQSPLIRVTFGYLAYDSLFWNYIEFYPFSRPHFVISSGAGNESMTMPTTYPLVETERHVWVAQVSALSLTQTCDPFNYQISATNSSLTQYKITWSTTGNCRFNTTSGSVTMLYLDRVSNGTKWYMDYGAIIGINSVETQPAVLPISFQSGLYMGVQEFSLPMTTTNGQFDIITSSPFSLTSNYGYNLINITFLNFRSYTCLGSDNYFEVDLKCYTTCPAHSLLNSPYQLCQPCHYSCFHCTGLTSVECVDCVATRNLTNNIDITCPCRDDHYEQQQYDCLPCSIMTACLACTDATHCTLCDTGYYVSTQCVLCNSTKPNCVACNPTYCTQCQPGYFLNVGTCQSSAVSICGNGVVEVNEQCDDANTNSNDGCSSQCLVEQNYVCRYVVALLRSECSYSLPLLITIVDVHVYTNNTVYVEIAVSPSFDCRPTLVVVPTMSLQQYNNNSILMSFSNDIVLSNMFVYFKPDNTVFGMYAIPQSNQQIGQGIYTVYHEYGIKYLCVVIMVLTLILLMMSLFVRGIAGIECLFMVQMSYLSISLVDAVHEALLALTVMASYINGYVYHVKSSRFLTSVLTYMRIQDDFIGNCNVMLLILLIAAVVYGVSKYLKKEQHVFREGMVVLSTVVLLIVYFSGGVFGREGAGGWVCLVLYSLYLAAIVFLVFKNEFGEFSRMVKTYHQATLLLAKALIALVMGLCYRVEMRAAIVLVFQLSYLVYVVVSRPYDKMMHNFRCIGIETVTFVFMVCLLAIQLTRTAPKELVWFITVILLLGVIASICIVAFDWLRGEVVKIHVPTESNQGIERTEETIRERPTKALDSLAIESVSKTVVNTVEQQIFI